MILYIFLAICFDSLPLYLNGPFVGVGFLPLVRSRDMNPPFSMPHDLKYVQVSDSPMPLQKGKPTDERGIPKIWRRTWLWSCPYAQHLGNVPNLGFYLYTKVPFNIIWKIFDTYSQCSQWPEQISTHQCM
jgi:hypothetical protein